jgi:cytochrome c oxidase assembly protein subunit 15
MVATGAVFLQLVLGALMRHLHAGLAVPDVPLAYGQLFPSLSPEALSGYNHELMLRDIRLSADDPITAAQVAVHVLHRYWAIVVAGLVSWTGVRLIALGHAAGRLRKLGALLLALVAVQITLGVMTVVSQKAVDLTTAHVATGALLLAMSVLATLHAARLYGLGARSGAAIAASVPAHGVAA